MVKALILDLDGTLIESHAAHVKSYKEIFEAKGLKPKHEDLAKHFGKIAEEIIKGVFPQLTEREVDDLVVGKRVRFLKLLHLVGLKPCVEDFLKQAGERFTLAIATSASQLEMDALLDQFGWSELFKVKLTSYDVAHPKPAPDLPLRVVEELGLSKSDCLFIGDSVFDARSAKAAGVEFWGVATGSYSLKVFEEEGFKAFSNLCSLMNSLL